MTTSRPQSPDDASHSFGALLKIGPFRNLWIAQLLSQTSHNGIHYVELLMIAQLTESTGHVGLMILAFTLPAVLFSAVAGVVVDRFPKRRVLVASNALRVLLALSYIVALKLFSGAPLIVWVYTATFLTSAIAQFFAPAEGATIPLLVGRKRLITANSLFNLTITGTQVLGLLVLFPLIIKLGNRWFGTGNGIEFSFALVALMYSIAVLLLRTLPPDPVLARVTRTGDATESALQRGWQEMREGLSFVKRTPTLWVAMINLSLTATIAYILAMVAPNYASNILRVSQEDAIYIFAPAGIGMLLGTFVIPRIGHAIRRETISSSGLALQGGMLTLMALVATRLTDQTTLLTWATMALAFSIGLGFAMIGIPAQTMLQERTPHTVRGRVFAAQYLLANSLAIVPMLVAGTIADRVGIPPVVLTTGLIIMIVAFWSFFWATRHRHEAHSSLI
ncbi:MAG: MFS transporter [Anaerolineales bacterium]|nr:MFS transporter [Anaerolineales bacterium]MCB9126647.1 MFS transporter [Ardenticatenales bacterium]MCB9172727.1 MFS transporter [Ardenticatenales bacterium]